LPFLTIEFAEAGQNRVVKFSRRSAFSAWWPLWLFAAALLLKSALPMLASASAQLQGKAVVEVCTVYGVKLVAQAPGSNDPPETAQHGGGEHESPHLGDHCALTSLAALATATSTPRTPVVKALNDHAPTGAQPAAQLHDATRAWLAQRKHGPPELS
jgi:hypothetical protein